MESTGRHHGCCYRPARCQSHLGLFAHRYGEDNPHAGNCLPPSTWWYTPFLTHACFMLSFNLKVQQLYWLFPWRASSNNCCKTAARLASRCLMETRLVTYSCKLLARALCSGPASRLRQRTDEPPNRVACLTRIPRVNWGVFLQLNWVSFWLTLMPQVRDALFKVMITFRIMKFQQLNWNIKLQEIDC